MLADLSRSTYEGLASAAQEGIWLACQTPESARAYAIPLVLKISPSQPLSLLRRAVEELVDRHAALRASFRHDGVNLIQVVKPHIIVALREVALDSGDSSSLRQFAESEAETPFDLETGPLVRAAVGEFGQEQYLALTFHHAIVDAWSLKVIIRDLVEFVAGTSTPFGAAGEVYSLLLPDSDLVEESLRYWRKQFATPPPHLPLCPPGLAGARSWRGDRHQIAFSAEEHTQLRALARSNRCTLHMLLVSLCYAFLARWTHERDIVLGVPYADRSDLEHQNVVGNFVNLLPLRYKADGAVTLIKILGDVRNLCLDAFMHARVPYSRIVGDAYVGGGEPIVQAVVGLHSELSDQARISRVNGVSFEWVDIHLPTAKFDIAWSFIEREGGLEGWIEADIGILDRQTASAMSESFCLFVRAAVKNPMALFTQLPLWGSSSSGVTTGAKTDFSRWGETLTEVFDRRATETPDALALITAEGEQTYDQLCKRSLAWAGKLQEAGVGPGSLVALLVGRDRELPALLLGILRLGAAYTVIDAAIPDARAQVLVEDAKAALLIVTEADSARVPSFLGARILVGAKLDTAFVEKKSAAVAESIACVMYTSGTTGTPKGAEISHQAVLRLLVDFPFAPLSAPTRLLVNASPSFDAFTFELWGALVNGGTAVLSPRSDLGALQLEEFLVAHAVNVAWLTSSYFNLIVDERPEALASLTCLVVGGEALSSPRIRRVQQALPQLQLVNGYGPTETTVFATCWSMPLNIGDGGIELGHPTPHAEVLLVGEDGRPAPPGAVGEILIGGIGLAHGYRGQPGLTADRFVPDDVGFSSSGRLYKTGDLAVRTSDGRLFFRGRADDQVKIRGYRVEPAEIDRALGRIPCVREGVTICREVAAEDRALVSLVLVEEGSIITEEAIRRALAGELPSYMVPARVLIVQGWPLTPSGKLDKRALAQLVEPVTPLTDRLEGLTDTEHQIAEIWRKLLGRPVSSRSASFLELGGHSLLALRMITEIRTKWSVELSLKAILKSPSLYAIAEFVDDHLAVVRNVAHSLPMADLSIPQPASLEQQRFWLDEQLCERPGENNIALVFHFDDVPILDKLQDSLERLQEWHAVLRTVYEFGSNGLMQRVLSSGVSTPLNTGAELEYQDAVERLERWGATAFDLASERQPRVALARIRGGGALLGLCFHHIALDTLALSVLLDDLGHLYGQSGLSDARQLMHQAPAYADYALAQRTGPPRQYCDMPPAQNLRSLVGLPPVQSIQADAARIIIEPPEDALERIRLGAATAGVSRFIFMLGLAVRALFATSDAERLAIAVPVVDRPSPEFARTVGCFLDVRVISVERPLEDNRMAFSNDLREKWSTVQDVALPFAEATSAARKAAGFDLETPPFPVLFNFDEGEPLSLELDGVKAQPLTPTRVRPKAPLCIIAELHQQSIRLAVEYRCTLVAAVAAEQIARALQEELATC